MDRRTFIGSLAGGLLASPFAAEALQVRKVPVIGYLDGPTPSLTQHLREAFRQGLQQHGWIGHARHSPEEEGPPSMVAAEIARRDELLWWLPG